MANGKCETARQAFSLRARDIETFYIARLRVLTIYMGNPEIPVGKSNGSRHFIWEALETMGCHLR